MFIRGAGSAQANPSRADTSVHPHYFHGAMYQPIMANTICTEPHSRHPPARPTKTSCSFGPDLTYGDMSSAASLPVSVLAGSDHACRIGCQLSVRRTSIKVQTEKCR